MTRGQRFLDELHHGVLVGDGATGTALFARGADTDQGIERLNLLAPDLVQKLHRDYVAAGSRVIETNTFGANRPRLAQYGAEDDTRAVILAGVALARAAATGDVYVAGSIGPLARVDGEAASAADRTAFFAEQIAALLEGGVDLLLFETFTDLEELVAGVEVARTLTEIPIVAQMAFVPGGMTAGGDNAEEMVRRCRAAGADVVGANCGHGVPSVQAAIRQMAPHGLPMSAYINAGFPEQVDGRLLYLATPDYLANRARDLVREGVRLIGGCCGTGPETIRAIARAIPRQAHALRVAVTQETPAQPAVPPADPRQSPILARGSVLVELDPPTDVTIAPVVDAAQALSASGATAITIADNPLASVRVDTLTVAALLQRESGLPVIPHLTGRDRNRIALQSTIMGAHVQGIRALLCVTGDPIRMYQEPNTSGVFDVTSVGLVQLVAEFNAGRRMAGGACTSFAVGVALNPNVRQISGQVGKLRRKIDAGAHFALTQPIFEEDRLALLEDALAQAGIDLPIYLGILPLSSWRNAEFLHNEVPGMQIPDAIRERLSRYEQLADQRAAGVEIAADLIQRFAPRVHGFYLITPRNRVEMVTPLIAQAKAVLAPGAQVR